MLRGVLTIGKRTVGKLRHGRFLGFREDKTAREVVRETSDHASFSLAKALSSKQSACRVSAGIGFGRMLLVAFIEWTVHNETIAPYMLPHLTGRPITLVGGEFALGDSVIGKHQLFRGTIRRRSDCRISR
jgi:hypothetical protein